MEFKEERKHISDSLKNDPFTKDIFEIIIFEDQCSSGKSPKENYLSLVRNCDIYIGILGEKYGSINDSGLSATHEEYNEYKKYNSDAFFYIKNVDNRDEKTQKFIDSIKDHVTYTTFNNKSNLLYSIKESLSEFIKKILLKIFLLMKELLKNLLLKI